MSAPTRDAAVGGLTFAAAYAVSNIKRDPNHARKVLEEAVRDMLPHLYSDETRKTIQEEMKK